MNRNRLLGSLLLLLVAAIWGTAFAFQRVGMEHIEPITFTACRMSLAALAVGLVSLCMRRGRAAVEDSDERIQVRDTVLGGMSCGAFLALASLFQQMGIVYTTAGKAGFITALYMLIVPILNSLVFRRRTTWLVWFAVMLGVVGMYLLCMSERLSLAQGDALILICAVLFSGHILCCDHFASRGDPIAISAVQFATAALVSWAGAFLMESPDLGGIASATVPILYCGIISGGVGYTLQIVAQQYSDPTVASLLLSLESVFAAIAGSVLLHEQMSTRELLGCVVMFVAIVIVQVPLIGCAHERDTHQA